MLTWMKMKILLKKLKYIKNRNFFCFLIAVHHNFVMKRYWEKRSERQAYMELNENEIKQLSEYEIKKLNEILADMKKVKISKTKQKINDIIYEVSTERKKQNLSQSDLAELTGLSQTTISRIETYVSTPTLPILIKIMNSLNLDLQIVHK